MEKVADNEGTLMVAMDFVRLHRDGNATTTSRWISRLFLLLILWMAKHGVNRLVSFVGFLSFFRIL